MARQNENESALVHESLSRRNALLRIGRWLLGSASVAALFAAGRFLRPGVSAGAPHIYPIGRLSDFRVGTLTWLREHELFVVRDETGLGTFSTRCTHLGCIIRRTAEGFLCPCHGARYDAQGQVLSGPARRPLPWYHRWLESDGRIWVDVAREVSPAPSPLAQGDSMLGVLPAAALFRLSSRGAPLGSRETSRQTNSVDCCGQAKEDSPPPSPLAQSDSMLGLLPTKDKQS